jgi:hypothetical protein
MITSGIRKGLRKAAHREIPRYDEELRREIDAVKVTASTVYTFQERWYLLDNWVKQLLREKKQPPFTGADLMKVRQEAYGNQALANGVLDQLYRRADDYLDDTRSRPSARK